ncbi:MAG TPA: hypothetical protein VGE52_02145 [Pirellulales bacterium]
MSETLLLLARGRIRLPENWNDVFVWVGCFGIAGAIYLWKESGVSLAENTGRIASLSVGAVSLTVLVVSFMMAPIPF